MSLSEDDCAVKIAVRERPLRKDADDDSSVIDYHTLNSNILVVNERPFVFDYVFRPNVSQAELFESLVRPLVKKALNGFNAIALAYGQTGTGKSYSMGLNSESFEGTNVGMIPRCMEEIFNAENDKESGKREISGSFIEIYNEKVYDLLADDSNEQINVKGCKFTGGIKQRITNIHEGYSLLNQGNKNRHVRPTKMNTQSSRSHAIFIVYIRKESDTNVTTSCLNLVDLAGSEGVRKTGHQGMALAEGVNINQGLLSIGKVLQALTTGSKVIPYRDSVLSSVLQDSLNANSYLSLLACVSPHKEDLSETMSTLRFAQNAKTLKHTPQINSIIMEIKKNKAKTPIKVNPLRTKNGVATPGKALFAPKSAAKNPIYRSNTFCTPNKVRKMEKRVNQSDIGLTPKEKLKFPAPDRRSTIIPRPPVFPLEGQGRFSVSNDTLDSRCSLLSMNMSTSTAIDASETQSYSPIVRKCLAEFQTTFDQKIEKLVQSLKPINGHQENAAPNVAADHLQTPHPTKEPTLSGDNSHWEKILRTIVREEVLSLTERKKSPVSVIPDSKQEEMENIRCQLFSSGSPIFKVPFPPVQECDTTLIVDTNSSQDDDTQSFYETVIQNTVPKPARRSRRIASMSETNENIDLFARPIMPVRRSVRLSSITVDEERRPMAGLRRSRRFSTMSERPKDIPIEVEPKKSRKPKSRPMPVRNEVIASYFKTRQSQVVPVAKKSAKSAKSDHQKAVLDMLNTGTIKELQILPQIGLKTAYQIITQRTLNGKFKNFDQISKLPVWRGKAWDRFKEVNNIS